METTDVREGIAIEQKVMAQKKTRQLQIIERIFTVITVIFILWIFISWIDVLHHNEYYFTYGEVLEYSKFNFFKVIEIINNLIRGGK